MPSGKSWPTNARLNHCAALCASCSSPEAAGGATRTRCLKQAVQFPSPAPTPVKRFLLKQGRQPGLIRTSLFVLLPFESFVQNDAGICEKGFHTGQPDGRVIRQLRIHRRNRVEQLQGRRLVHQKFLRRPDVHANHCPAGAAGGGSDFPVERLRADELKVGCSNGFLTLLAASVKI